MQSAPINATASGANTIVAAQAGQRIRVLGFVLDAAGVVTITWQDGAGAALSGPLTLPANAPIVAAPIAPAIMGSACYWMTTGPGQSLQLNLSSAVAVGGMVIFDVV
jgi:hypothetical protein